jgi:GTPase SAR1 family protein
MQSKPPTSSFQSYHKIVFLGKQGVNKSLLVQKLLGSASKSEHDLLGIEYHNLEIEHQNKVHYLQFWDLSSHFDKELSIFLRNTSSIVFVFDFNDKNSQLYVQDLYGVIMDFLSLEKKIIVGLTNKVGKIKASKDFTNWIKEKEFLIHQVFLEKNEGISQLLQMIVQQLDKEAG